MFAKILGKFSITSEHLLPGNIGRQNREQHTITCPLTRTCPIARVCVCIVLPCMPQTCFVSHFE